jgi:hypothetical protein
LFGFLDDCIIFGDTKEEFLRNLDTVLNRFREMGIKIKRSKCQFGLEKIGFLGHEVSGDSISLSVDRKKALKELAQPKTVTQLRSFLGAANYFRQFIDGYALMSRDLHQLAAKSPSKLLVWTPALLAAWERVKQAVVTAPELTHMSDSPDDKIILYTDASDYAFGGYLAQLQDGIERPILFYSKVFNDVQSRWSVSDKEMYSIVHGVLANHYLLMGRPFTIRSDHKALMFNEKISASNKIERWKVSLSEYDIKWEFIEGAQNVVADALSRVIETTANVLDSDELEPLTVLVLNELVTSTTSGPDELETVSQEQWQIETIRTHHSPAHFNSHDTYKSLTNHNLEWRGMRAMVNDFTTACKICQLLKTRTHPGQSGSFILKSDKPGDRICFDVLEWEEDLYGFNFLLVIVDCFHSYTTLVPLKTIRAGEIYNALIKYFCEDGIPSSATFDKGASLNAEIVTSLTKFLNINSIVTTARSSEENGIAEQKIRMVRQVFTLLNEEQKESSAVSSGELAWSTLIPFTQRALNIMTGTTGYSPAEIRFGIHNRLDGIKIPLVPPDLMAQQKELLQNAKENLEKKLSRKQIKDLSVFKTNDLVIIKNPTHLKRNAAHKPYLGPFKVTSQTNTNLTLTLASNPSIMKVVKTSEAFKFKGSDVPVSLVGAPVGLKLIPHVPMDQSE